MYAVYLTEIVLLCLVIFSLLAMRDAKKHNQDKAYGEAHGLLALSSVVAVIFIGAATYSQLNPKAAETPLPMWVVYIFLILFFSFPFFMEVLGRYQQRGKAEPEAEVTEEFVMGMGFVAIFVSGFSWMKWEFSAWFLPLLVPFAWLTIIALWLFFVKLFVRIAEQLFRREQGEN